MPDGTSCIAEVSEERVFGIAFFSFLKNSHMLAIHCFFFFFFAHIFFASFSKSSAIAQMNSFDQSVLNAHHVPDTFQTQC